MSQMVIALLMAPVEVGAPSSRMGLGSGGSESNPFIENTISSAYRGR